MLELKNITKVYGKKAALQDVSVAFAPGQIVGLFGENGAGKTTLMKCILGLIGHKGEVTLDGEAIGCGNIARLSFATCEHSFFPRLSPKAHREFYGEHFPRFNDKRFAALMDFFSLPMDKALRSYSVGMQNQFEVVLGLCYLAWRFITPEQCIPTAENIQRVMNAIAASPYSHYYG